MQGEAFHFETLNSPPGLCCIVFRPRSLFKCFFPRANFSPGFNCLMDREENRAVSAFLPPFSPPSDVSTVGQHNYLTVTYFKPPVMA